MAVIRLLDDDTLDSYGSLLLLFNLSVDRARRSPSIITDFTLHRYQPRNLSTYPDDS
jgi:hypothetical protein